MKKHLPALIFFVVVTSVLEILVQTQVINSTLIPAPSAVAQSLHDLRSEFQSAFLESFGNVFAGFTFSVIMGLVLACLFSLSDLLRRAVLPFAVFFQTVPIIAIAPLLVIYFGFGSSTVIASSFIVSVFPMIANTLIGLESTQPAQRDLFFYLPGLSLGKSVASKTPFGIQLDLCGFKGFRRPCNHWCGRRRVRGRWRLRVDD